MECLPWTSLTYGAWYMASEGTQRASFSARLTFAFEMRLRGILFSRLAHFHASRSASLTSVFKKRSRACSQSLALSCAETCSHVVGESGGSLLRGSLTITWER